MNMAVPASFFQRDIATETAGFFGGGAESTLDLDSVDSVLESGGLFAAASGSPGAVVTVGGGVNGATLELAVLARLDCQQCCWLGTVPFVNHLPILLLMLLDYTRQMYHGHTVQSVHYRFCAMGE